MARRVAWTVAGLLLAAAGVALVVIALPGVVRPLSDGGSLALAASPTPLDTPVPDSTWTPAPTATLTREPLVPTVTLAVTHEVAMEPVAAVASVTPAETASPGPTATVEDVAVLPTGLASPTETRTPRASPTATRTPVPTATRTRRPEPVGGNLWQGHLRWGVGVTSPSLSDFDVTPLRLGWYMNWSIIPAQGTLESVEYVPLVRVRDGRIVDDLDAIRQAAARTPGMTWLISNEPDVKWQDNTPAGELARLYHDAYTVIKEADPSAQDRGGGHLAADPASPALPGYLPGLVPPAVRRRSPGRRLEHP